MGGDMGPPEPWSFVGVTNLLATGAVQAEPRFPASIQPGDLVVGVMSPYDESVPTAMTTLGWMHFANRSQDYICAARYVPDLALPKWERAGGSALFISLLVFRARSWSVVRLESHISPAAPVDVPCVTRNELLLSIGITPRTTRSWVGHMPDEAPVARVERALAPAMQIYSANIDNPRLVSGVYVDAASGAERNLILSAF